MLDPAFECSAHPLGASASHAELESDSRVNVEKKYAQTFLRSSCLGLRVVKKISSPPTLKAPGGSIYKEKPILLTLEAHPALPCGFAQGEPLHRRKTSLRGENLTFSTKKTTFNLEKVIFPLESVFFPFRITALVKRHFSLVFLYTFKKELQKWQLQKKPRQKKLQKKQRPPKKRLLLKK
jgi:hypothetical protein